MKLAVYFTPPAAGAPVAFAGKPAVVIDVFRATTTIVSAMANGARVILPAESSEEALKVAQNLERGERLLAGERRCERIPGFDLGNSPLEMTPEAVRGKTLIMATTNGTPAFRASDSGRPVFVAAITNLSAVGAAARAALEEAGELHIVCAGRERLFALEDAYLAGRLVMAATTGRGGARKGLELNDAAKAAVDLVRRWGTRWKTAIAGGAAARELQRLKFKADVLAATEVDRHAIVPVYADRRITVPNRG
jgi:2-phosphosulfolactate phosphatase